MKVVQINTLCGYAAPGRIATEIHQELIKKGHDSYVAYGRGQIRNIELDKAIKIGGKLNVLFHQLGTRMLGKHGFYSKVATKRFIKKLKKVKPDIVHLHNIHGYYLNVEILFKYLKDSNVKVFWTLHDCWSFTGHCAYYDYAKCYKWKEECYECPELKQYPKSLCFDRSKESFRDKKTLFNSVGEITFITPSEWLANELKESFLKNHPVKVINNGIDLSTFYPVVDNTKKTYDIAKKFIILGVAGVWDRRKGLNYFMDLSKKISGDDIIFLVGLEDKIIKTLPNNIIGISRTENVSELASIYSMADVFVNPTLEDNFPTTNLESLACGTPVITFSTGGSPEAVDHKTGFVVEKGDIEGLLKAINKVKENTKDFYSNSCVLRAQKLYDREVKFDEYIDLYKDYFDF